MDRGPTTPTSPGDRPHARSRGISFRSDKSGGSGDRSKFTESPREKAQRDSLWKAQSKANPNAAIIEAQPGVANVTEESTLSNLREAQHKDAFGNVIADPDRSNPTRPRLERPLDTIRSFERAIDDGYRRRSSYVKQDSSDQYDKDNQFASRRSSYFSGYEGPSPSRPPPGGNVGGYYGSQSYHGPPRARYGGNRMQQQDAYGGQQRPYGGHGYHQSYDTVNTGYTNGSDSTGPWANSTDPSSENSSIDKVNAMNKQPMQMNGYDQYAGNGYNGPIMEEQGGAHNYGGQWHGNANGQASSSGMHDYGYQNGQQPDYGQRTGWPPGPPPPPQQQPVQQPSQARRPIKLGGNGAENGYDRAPANLPPSTLRKEPTPEKKQGWLKRRFSKKT